MAYALKFGSYTFPTTFAPVSDPVDVSVPLSKIPRSDGDVASTGYRKGKVVQIDGGLTNGVGSYSETGVRTLIDAFRAGIAGKQNLYFFDDRYYRNAQMTHAEFANEVGTFLKIQKVRLTFVAGDSYQYAVTPTVTARSISASGQTLSVTAGGTADAIPVISLTVGGSGAKTLAATITNSTTGKAFTLAGACTGGDVIIVDCLNKTVTISGVDKTALFDGLFWSLANGANTVTVAYTTATITNLSVSAQDRWY